MRKVLNIILAGAVATAAACASSDPGVTTAVKSKLAADDTVKAYQIDVDTAGGVVTLTGAVETEAAKERAVQLARETDGVTRVEDRLTVNPALTLDNRAGDAAADLGQRAEGTAGTAADKAGDATKSAADKAGDAAEKLGDAAKATGAAAAQAAKDATPVVADAGITAAVKTRMLADPDVAGLRIDVDTKGKIVTLTGTVKSAAQVAEAEKIARETPGVTRVVNNLKVGVVR